MEKGKEKEVLERFTVDLRVLEGPWYHRPWGSGVPGAGMHRTLNLSSAHSPVLRLRQF